MNPEPMTDTRDESYEQVLLSLGEKQTMVLTLIKEHPGLSSYELAHVMGWGTNSIAPRIFELRALGLIEDAGK